MPEYRGNQDLKIGRCLRECDGGGGWGGNILMHHRSRESWINNPKNPSTLPPLLPTPEAGLPRSRQCGLISFQGVKLRSYSHIGISVCLSVFCGGRSTEEFLRCDRPEAWSPSPLPRSTKRPPLFSLDLRKEAFRNRGRAGIKRGDLTSTSGGGEQRGGWQRVAA